MFRSVDFAAPAEAQVRQRLGWTCEAIRGTVGCL